MKLKPVSAASAAPIRLDFGTPPDRVHRTPVPAHSMHSSAWRRSTPLSSRCAMFRSPLRARLGPFRDKTRGGSGLFPPTGNLATAWVNFAQWPRFPALGRDCAVFVDLQ